MELVADGLILANITMHDGNVCLTRSLVIHQDCSWQVQTEGKRLTCSSSMLSVLPQVVSSVADVQNIITFIDSCTTCAGNDDEKFTPLIAARKGAFMDASGNLFVIMHEGQYCTSSILFFSSMQAQSV